MLFLHSLLFFILFFCTRFFSLSLLLFFIPFFFFLCNRNFFSLFIMFFLVLPHSILSSSDFSLPSFSLTPVCFLQLFLFICFIYLLFFPTFPFSLLSLIFLSCAPSLCQPQVKVGPPLPPITSPTLPCPAPLRPAAVSWLEAVKGLQYHRRSNI